MMSMRRYAFPAAVVALLPVVSGCDGGAEVPAPIVGVDLSYVNEIEDCGGLFEGFEGETDPYVILSSLGANLVRARLWHTAEWTDYSNVGDVIRTFERAKDAGMATLLDFHYSDEWADPGRQNRPAAWDHIEDVGELAAALGDYTTDVLTQLDDAGVVPDIVQIGNETNGGLVKSPVGVDWAHDLPLFTAGINAVRAFADLGGHDIDVAIHIAQPENALSWFDEATTAGLTDYDIIGLSFYPQWSRFSVGDLGNAVAQMADTYDKDVLIVETAYPWTLDSLPETADNILDQGLQQYPISPQGQALFMADLTSAAVANGGLGTVYWEPAWISTDCSTRWGQGSHWENATLFDFSGNVHDGASYLSGEYATMEIPEPTAETHRDDIGDYSDPDADLTSIGAAADDNVLYIEATLAGDLESWQGVIIAAIDTVDGGGDGGRRGFAYDAATQPELIIETSFNDSPGVGYTSSKLLSWEGGAWSERSFLGSIRVDATETGGSRVTWLLPRQAIAGGDTVNLTVLTAERGRAGDLADAVAGDTSQDVPMPLTIGDLR